MFSTLLKTEIIFLETLNLSSANAFNLEEGKILLFGKELTLHDRILCFQDPGKENTVGKEENAGYQYFVRSIYPFPNKPWFLRVCSASRLKKLWERRNCS